MIEKATSSKSDQENLEEFANNKEIEPEDNIEDLQEQSESSDYDTELDTDELIGNRFFANTSSNNNSIEHQEKMLSSGKTRKPVPFQMGIEGKKSSAKLSGGIKCLRNFRRP